ADEATFTSVDVDAGGAATTNIGFDAGQGSGTIHKTPTRPHDLPLPRVHTHRSDEGSMQQNELMDLVTKLTDKVEVLENDLQQTKKVYSSALTKLILRVKKLEKNVKTNKARRRARIVILKDEDANEDSSKHGRKISQIDKDPIISLLEISTANILVSTAGTAVTTASASISTVSPPKVSTAKDISGAETLVDEELAKKVQEEEQARFNAEQEAQFKAEREQEKYDFETALKLQKQLDERGKVQPAGERLKRKVSKAREDKNKRQKMQDDPEKLTLKEYVEVISDLEEGDMTVMFEPDGNDEVWKNHQNQKLIEWKLYDSYGVHSLMLGEVTIYMLVEKKYPLPRDTLTKMLQWKLHVNNNVTEMTYELLRFIKSQLH
ncbi:hypothetical protein Tco_1039968, partial [Tanacetum coccineum]